MAASSEFLEVRCGDLVRTQRMIAGELVEDVGRVSQVSPEYVVVGLLAFERGEVVEVLEEAEPDWYRDAEAGRINEREMWGPVGRPHVAGGGE